MEASLRSLCMVPEGLPLLLDAYSVRPGRRPVSPRLERVQSLAPWTSATARASSPRYQRSAQPVGPDRRLVLELGKDRRTDGPAV